MGAVNMCELTRLVFDGREAEARRVLTRTIKLYAGNLVQVAAALGVTRMTVSRYVARLALEAVVDRARGDGGAGRRRGRRAAKARGLAAKA